MSERAKRVPCDGVFDPACVERFWAKVGAPDANGCRRWTAKTELVSGLPRGRFAGGPWRVVRSGSQAGGRRRALVYAHVFVWTLFRGPVPEGLQVRHTCDVSNCCEITHMILGTPQQNIDDRTSRFVNSRGGEGHGQAKLTHAQAREIYALAWEGAPQQVLADGYGVSLGVVSNIKRERAWRNTTRDLREARAA